MSVAVHLLGLGRVEVAAYGVADAEHRVETEWNRLWPGTALQITGIARTEPNQKIVEHFAIAYGARVVVPAEAEEPKAALREAYRRARERVHGTLFHRAEWASSPPAPAAAETA